MWLFLKKRGKLNVSDTQSKFLVGNCWTSTQKGKNNQPNTQKTTQERGFSWEKSPHFNFLQQNQAAATAKKPPSSTWGRKIILPKEAAFPQAGLALPHPIFFYMDKEEIRALVKAVCPTRRWNLGIRWAGMSGPSTAQPSCHGRSPGQASPSQGWSCQSGFQKDGNRFPS